MLAGGLTDEALASSVEFLATFSFGDVDAAVLLNEMADSWLQVRLRGDLILLAETITEDAAMSLLAAMTALARSCPDANSAMLVVEECRSLLGMQDRTSFFRRRSR